VTDRSRGGRHEWRAVHTVYALHAPRVKRAGAASLSPPLFFSPAPDRSHGHAHARTTTSNSTIAALCRPSRSRRRHDGAVLYARIYTSAGDGFFRERRRPRSLRAPEITIIIVFYTYHTYTLTLYYYLITIKT